MNLLTAEFVKLASMRSVRLLGVISLAIAVAYSALWADRNRALPDTVESPLTARGIPPSIDATQLGCVPGVALIMIAAVLTATTEYRTGTINLTFLAAPRRASVVLAKTLAVCISAGAIGEIAAWLAYGVGKLISPESVASLASAADVRLIAGTGLVYLVAAAAGVSIGLIVKRGFAALGAIGLLLLIFEIILPAIPFVGTAFQQWSPVGAASWFLYDGSTEMSGVAPDFGVAGGFSWWWSFAYISAIGLGLTVIAVKVTARRG